MLDPQNKPPDPLPMCSEDTQEEHPAVEEKNSSEGKGGDPCSKKTEENNRDAFSYASKIRSGASLRKENKKSYPVWEKIFIDWKDINNHNIKGFYPKTFHYKKIFELLSLGNEDLDRINDCKSGAGHIILYFKKPQNVLLKFNNIETSRFELENNIYFQIRGLENLRKSQKPIDILIKNGYETDLTSLKETLSLFGELIGDFEDVHHSVGPGEEKDVEFLKVFNGLKSGRLTIKIKPSKKIPMIVPIRGKKVELQSELQILQCYKCLKFGHIKSNCQNLQKTSYKDFEEYFRFELNLTTRVEGAEERRLREEAAREEEEEEEENETEIRVVNDDREGSEESKGTDVEISSSEASSSKILSQKEAWKVVLRKRPEMTSKGSDEKSSTTKKSKRLRESPEEHRKKTKEKDPSIRPDSS